MKFFLTQVELVLPVLGLDILRLQSHLQKTKIGSTAEVADRSSSGALISPTFIFSDAGTSAEAQETNNEFIVKAGSIARRRETPTIPGTARLLRKQFQEDGTLIPQGDDMLVFTKDVAFKSPSGAGGAIYGGSVNGRTSWKEKDTNVSYGEWRERSLEASTFAAALNDADE